ncbi:MAG: alanyl-tRNA editing protein [Kineosporiaceae bacterium]|jgi:misacylated tRNA(Ala) deacylase
MPDPTPAPAPPPTATTPAARPTAPPDAAPGLGDRTGSDRFGRTLRLELVDQDLRDWEAVVLDADPARGLVLDRSAFYPGGGGQAADHGVLTWDGGRTRIIGTRREEDPWLLPHADDPLPAAGTRVRAELDDVRRTGLMRTHSALHLLSGIVFRDVGAQVTGGNMEPLQARMDFSLPTVPDGFREALTRACAEEIAADRPITAFTLPREDAFARYPDLIRTATNLLPDDLQEVRIVDIAGLDTQADGGTHVASTRLIGGIEIVKVENKGKGFRRVRIRITPGPG